MAGNIPHFCFPLDSCRLPATNNQRLSSSTVCDFALQSQHMIAPQCTDDCTTSPPMIREGYELHLVVIEDESGHPKGPSRQRIGTSLSSLYRRPSNRMKSGSDLRGFFYSAPAIQLDFLRKGRRATASVNPLLSGRISTGTQILARVATAFVPGYARAGPIAEKTSISSHSHWFAADRVLRFEPTSCRSRKSRMPPSTFVD